MKLYLISAHARNRVIGNKGRIPWDLPEDMKLFQERTTGHAVLMGRTTYDLLPAPLPHRRNVVLTHRPLEGQESYASLSEALEALSLEKEVYVIGGGTVYEQTLERADGMILSIVDLEPEGDAFFPEYADLIGKEMHEVSRRSYEGFDLVEYVRHPQQH